VLGIENLHDIDVYSRDRLAYVAEEQEMGSAWPAEPMLLKFTDKARGLFVWVSVATSYLASLEYSDINEELEALLDGGIDSEHELSPEVRMDAMYKRVLESLPWKERRFPDKYRLILATVLAARVPISANAVQTLQEDPAASDVLGFLKLIRSLLVSSLDDTTPIQLIHASFADFVTTRALLSEGTRQFGLNSKLRSREIARICISILVKDLNGSLLPQLGFLTTPQDASSQNIPPVEVPEATGYACRFWISHLLDVEEPVESLLIQCRSFMSSCFAPWLELIVSIGRIEPLGKLISWFKVRSLCSKRGQRN
jgi:hypothetical protein